MQVQLRPATQTDARAIWRLARRTGINPLGLRWQRMLVAFAPDGAVVGCGQIKPHGALRELASIAVLPEWQRQGIGNAIVTRLLEQAPLPLYLMCAEHRESFYIPFGFRSLSPAEMPAYFRRYYQMMHLAKRLVPGLAELRIMMKE